MSAEQSSSSFWSMVDPHDFYLRLRGIVKMKESAGSMPKKGKEAPGAAIQDIDESERQLLKSLDDATTTSSTSSARNLMDLVEAASGMNTRFKEEWQRLLKSSIDGSMPKKGKEAPRAAIQDIDESDRQLSKLFYGATTSSTSSAQNLMDLVEATGFVEWPWCIKSITDGSMPKKGKEAPRATFQDIDVSERQLLKPLDGATTSSTSSAQYQMDLAEANFKEERLIGRIVDGFALPDPILIGYPILFSATGFKHAGAEKLKTIDVLVHFIPENLRSKDIITTSINKCQMSIDGYRNIGNFDLTKVKQEEELPHVKLVHPCTCCNLEQENAGHYGAVKVGIKAVYRQLLGKQQFVDYQINCGSTGTPIGVVIFSKLKKSHTGLKRILAGVHETAKEVGPYVGPVLGAVGFFVN